MESSLTVSRRRPPSHMRDRDGHPIEPDRPFVVKRHRDGSREQAHILSDDEDVPTTKGEKHRRKKKHSATSVNPPSSSGPRPGLSTDTYVERPQKSSRQKQGTSRSFIDVSTTVARPMLRGRKEASRDGKHSSAKASSAVAISDDEVGPQPSYSGPIAAMEFNRMRRELESLKKQSTAHTKTVEKQANTILSLQNELRSMQRTHKEQASQIVVLETKTKQVEELTSNIEGTLQCQICIDTLTKPFALSPCGHVLCQGCLQDWFRNAPVPQDEMSIDEPLPLILRKKTCPFCRAVIRSRPLPLFILKNLLSVLAKSKSSGAAGSVQPSPPPDLDDPWAEIFPPLISGSESYAEDDGDLSEDDYWGPYGMYDDDDDDDDEDEDEEEDEDEDVEGLQEYDDSSNDEYEGEWVAPKWEPPMHRAATPLDPDPGTDVLLRRGATYGMIETYDVQYAHGEGLTALVDDMCLYLGWNIELMDEDEDGGSFIAWCLDDMEANFYRWSFLEGDGHIHRLVRRDALEEYDSTDSERYIGDEEEGVDDE